MKISIISQTKRLLDTEGTMVTVPTTTGIIGILPGHENIVSLLDTGIIKIKKADKEEQKIVINGGVIEVVNDEIKILANEAALPEEIVKEEIDEAIEMAKKKIATKLPPTELIQLEKQLRYQKLKKEIAL